MIKHLIHNVDVFRLLNATEIRILEKMLILKDYKKNQTIISQGSYGHEIYVITSGSVTVQVQLPGDLSRPIATLGRGDFFGEVSSLIDTEHTATIVTKMRTKCLVLRKEFIQILEVTHPQMYRKILHAIACVVHDRLSGIYNEIRQKESIKSCLYYDDINFNTEIKSVKCTKKILMSNIDNLHSCHLINTLSSKQIEDLFLGCMILKLPKLSCLLKPNDNSDSLYLVLSGALQNNVLNNQKVLKMSVNSVGSLIGQSTLFGIESHETIIVVRTEATLVKLDKKRLRSLEKNNRELWNKLFFYTVQSYLEKMITANRQLTRIKTEGSD